MPEKPARSDRKDDGVELETQFILRLPEDTANNLKSVIQSGASKLTIIIRYKFIND